MRDEFPGHFRPSIEDLKTLWSKAIFAVDANVLLHLYRYSENTRDALEKALQALSDRLFLPHQTAKEFLRNRHEVTAGQAKEYSGAMAELDKITESFAHTKKHPFLPPEMLARFTAIKEEVCIECEKRKTDLLGRLTGEDGILASVESIFKGKTGKPLDDEQFRKLTAEGASRYSARVPPGFMDGNRDHPDANRKYGDLIIWKQLMLKAKADSLPLIFITG